MKAKNRHAKLIARAEDVFEDSAEVARWLNTPLDSIGGKTPLDFADTEPGASEVEQILGRIEHGVFS